MQRVQSPIGAMTLVEGRQILNFGGTPYLGLSNETELVEAASQAIRRQGSTGQLPRHYDFVLEVNSDVEEAGAEFFDAEGAIYYATGYLFGLMTLTALADDYDVAFIDESAHYNLFEGAKAAGRPIITFKHRDVGDLETKLRAHLRPDQVPLVATDGMFATFGTIPPLDIYQQLISDHNGWLIVDESHSFGSVGERGRGACAYLGVKGPRVVRGGSMAKAFCAYGGLTVADQAVIDKLWKSPTARGAASGMSAGAAMTAASFRFVQNNPDVLERLQANRRILRSIIEGFGVNVPETPSSVCAFEFGSRADMDRIQSQLYEDFNIFIMHSFYVGAGPEGVLRLAAFSDHTDEHFRQLEQALEVILN